MRRVETGLLKDSSQHLAKAARSAKRGEKVKEAGSVARRREVDRWNARCRGGRSKESGGREAGGSDVRVLTHLTGRRVSE